MNQTAPRSPSLSFRVVNFVRRLVGGVFWLLFAPWLLWRLRPRKSFASTATPPAPDYSTSNAWAARPEQPRKATLAPGTPAGQRPDSTVDRDFDVFYIYPTLHLSGRSWNAGVDDARVNELVDELVIAGQASAFARACRVYAPRYRLATLYSFLGGNDDCRQALELAYSDVVRAFDHYLEHDNQGRPFFLASHSQGSCHAIRLLEERIEANGDVHDRLVAAYVLGYTIPRDKFRSEHPQGVFEKLHPSKGPRDVGCVVSWDTFGRSGGPLHRSDKAEIWYSEPIGDATQRAGFHETETGYWRPRAFLPIVGVNPLTFDTETGWRSREAHRGGVHTVLSARISPRALFFDETRPLGVRTKALSQPIPRHVDAALAEDGYLYITEPRAAAFQRAVMPGRSFHNHDYGLFYADIEANVAERAAAFQERQGGTPAMAQSAS